MRTPRRNELRFLFLTDNSSRATRISGELAGTETDGAIHWTIEAAYLPTSCAWDLIYMPAWFALLHKSDGEFGSLPVWIAYGESTHLLTCIELGAGDYLAEPWSIGELRQRGIAAVSRMSGRSSLELEGSVLSSPEQSVVLTPEEQRVLGILMRNEMRTVPRDVLSIHPNGRSLDVVISRLRKKLRTFSQCRKESSGIQTVFDRGYRFVCPSDVDNLWKT